jgi:hypothetical protein
VLAAYNRIVLEQELNGLRQPASGELVSQVIRLYRPA